MPVAHPETVVAVDDSKLESSEEVASAPQDRPSQVADKPRLKAPHIYEVVAQEGREELSRPTLSLFTSGIAAGLGMGASVCGYAWLHGGDEAVLRSQTSSIHTDDGWLARSLLVNRA